MLKWLVIALLFLSGCGKNLESEAQAAARDAIEVGNFERGSLLLVAGGCDLLHAQSVYLLHMVNHHNDGDVLGVFYAWQNLTGINASEDFIWEAALLFVTEILSVEND